MHKFFFTSFAFALIVSAFAQQRTPLTNKDYEQAQRYVSTNAEQLVDHATVRPNWLSGDRFWYRDLNAKGGEFILVDPAKGTRTIAFDHQKLAGALSEASGKQYEANRLPFQTISFAPDNKSVSFQLGGKWWKYDIQANQVTASSAPAQPITEAGDGGRPPRGEAAGLEVFSPDKKKAAYIKDYNLWVRDVPTGQQTQLTTDGV
ncbi:DPP IV N-terminal domain-containing protein, partial [Spirosoma sp.]|uniref:DPP IV N-terminal domain-containing protein n=1 Tax=Spirosoma sp. TaxID=1899569 RepID=UPI003B3B9D46